MATTLLAVVIALALGHFAPALAASVRRHDAMATFAARIGSAFGSPWRGPHAVAVFVLPLGLLVGAVQFVLGEAWLTGASLLWGVAVLFFCWGPRDLDVDVRAIRDAPDHAARREAAARLWPLGEVHSTDGGSLVEAVMRNALRRWFGVLFWFAVLGAFGAVAYRLSVVAAEQGERFGMSPGAAQGARTWLGWIEWPVAQLMVAAMALVGAFDAVLEAWKRTDGAAFAPHHRFLGAAARASVRNEIAEEVADYADTGVSAPTALDLAFGPLPELTDAMRLVWRMLALWMAVLAVFVIVAMAF